MVPLLKKRGIHRLDTVILTHEDNDHAGGLQAVLQTFPVTRFVFNGTLKSSPPVEKTVYCGCEQADSASACRQRNTAC